MKIRITFLLMLSITTFTSFAQFDVANFSVGAAGNYTRYLGDFQKSATGVKLEVGYGLSEKLGYTIGFIKGFPIKSASNVTISDGNNQSSVSSDIETKFTTIMIGARYTFLDEDAKFRFYVPLSLGYVTAKYSEKIKSAIPAGYTATDQLEPGKETGFTINVGFGVSYKLGAPVIFADAGVGLPANNVNGDIVENYIPFHFGVNVGVRIGFGN